MSEEQTTGLRIDRSIVDMEIVKDDSMSQLQLEEVHEGMSRPTELYGTTYRIRPPTVGCSMFITINDVVINQGTEHEQRRPFEIFINSKDVDHYQWTVALTRIISAIFRKGGDLSFLIEELNSVFDPKGGYFKPGSGGRYMPSLIAEIGDVIEKHLKHIGYLKDEGLDEHTREFIEQKRQEHEQQQANETAETQHKPDSVNDRAQCPKCQQFEMVVLDGCWTCLNCGESKCG